MPPDSATSPLPSSREIELETLNRASIQAPELFNIRSTEKGREQPEGELGSRPGPPPTNLEIDPSPTSGQDDQPPPSENEETGIPKWPFACLILQHFSSAWTDRTYEFAAYLYLVILFPGSFVPAALLGLLTTATSLVGSGWVGGLVDSRKRLAFVRVSIAVQKASTAASYALFVVLFVPLRDATQTTWQAPSTTAVIPALESAKSLHSVVYFVLALLIVTSSAAGLASGGLNVSIQRDWVMTISNDNTRHLTILNTYLRRVDLLCKLLSPLLVSLLTTAASYQFSLYFYLGLTVLSTAFEYVWIAVVYRAFPVLAKEEAERQARINNEKEARRSKGCRSAQQLYDIAVEDFKQMGRDWADFAQQPVFLSSIAISLVYLTTLSFDGIMLSYLKSQRSFSDPFIAGMRGLSVVMGLIGTAVMPFMERRMGLVRGGAWSLWAEIICLAPPVVTLFVGLPKWNPPGHGEPWNIGVFFAFISLSRIGLWSFDLFQLQTLQESLKDHPRRNRLTALQLSLQSAFDLAKYGMTLGWSSPKDYKWTAVVSFGALLLAGGVYTAFIWRMRGHLFHWKRIKEEPTTSAEGKDSPESHAHWRPRTKRREWGEELTKRKTETGGTESQRIQVQTSS